MDQKEKQLLEGTGVKILIVDDISKNLYMLEVLFKSAGYDTISAKNGIEALEKLRTNQIDGIVSDILMPLMDGFRLIRECKKDPVLRQIPFIFYTATYTEKKDYDFGLFLGAIRYIIKPAEPEELLRQINEAFQEHMRSPRNYTMQPVLDEITFNREYTQRVGAKLEKKARLLEESEERYRLLYENSMDAIFLTISDGSILAANPAACEMFGRTEEEIVQGERNNIIDASDPRLVPALVERKRTGKFAGELTFLRTDGTKFPGEISTSLFTDHQGQIRTSMIIRDISERKQAEVQRELLIKELEQKNADLERFNYTVSHDLKTPLITIKWFAGLLEEDVRQSDPVQMKKDAHRITDAVDTMEALLIDLLELSRVGRIVKPLEQIGFDTIVHEATNILEGPLTERGLNVEIAPVFPDVYVDRNRIREVLVNLIENAVKFLGTQPDPVIRIGVDDTGETPVFFVQDNGIGINPHYLKRIFNPFERLDTAAPGTGIGLTIVRHIIELHGGMIWAESEGLGKGATFRFTLPDPRKKSDITT